MSPGLPQKIVNVPMTDTCQFCGNEQNAEHIGHLFVREFQDATWLAEIYWTGDLIRPDDTDTNVYGEACEPGYGQTMESGWVDPNWSVWLTWDNKEDVKPDVLEAWELEEGESVDEAILRLIEERISIDSFDGTTAYAAMPYEHYKTGESMMLAAHVERR
jgi:hypothetical protein